MLSEAPSKQPPEKLLSELKAATEGLSYSPLAYQSLGSTNDEALRLAPAAKSLTIVAAATQSLGRGRLDRTWYGAEGDIMMSIILCEPHLPKNWWLLPVLPAIAILRALLSLGLNVKLKWPNDIVFKQEQTKVLHFADTRKLGGILVENVFCSEKLSASIIGIGLNVESRSELLALVPHAGFLKSYQPNISRLMVLKHVLVEFEKLISSINQPGFNDRLILEYEANCETLGRQVLLQTPQGLITARAKSINSNGALVVNDGIKDRMIVAGDVNFCIDY